MEKITEDQYREKFGVGSDKEEKKDRKVEKALKYALDIRKFEIDLYWKRAAYFWALIAAAFAGYFAILSSKELRCDKYYLAYIVSCIGLIFTWAWFLVNRGSKYWQENWENHVDMLEDEVTGPLYKTILHRPHEKDTFEKYITGPSAVSVSKINQWVSLFTLCIWFVLILYTLPKQTTRHTSTKYFIVGGITVFFIILMKRKGKTFKGSYEHIAKMRDTKII
jgi:hypothetical protein